MILPPPIAIIISNFISLNFERLEKGFNLEKSFIQKCLQKNNIIGDIDLFKEFYLRNDIITPLRKNGKNLEYYNTKWILNKNNLSTNKGIFACLPVKKAIAAPLQIIEQLNFIFSLMNNPNFSCVPPPKFIKI